MKGTQLAALMMAASGIALAGDWSDYKAAFPLFPCADGWTSCEVDGATLGPDMVADSEGNPMPANMRFGFWAFDSLPAASPFVGLSDYDGEMGDRSLKDGGGTDAVAVDDFGGVDEIPDIPINEQVNLSDDTPVPAGSDGGGGYEEPVRDVEEPDYGRDVSTGDEPKFTPPTMDALRDARETPDADPIPEPDPEPPPPEPDPEPEPSNDAVAAADLPPPPPPPVQSATCDDLRALETKAILGNLGVEARKCLDLRLAGASKLTDKDKISRVLISDAKARGDQADWDRLMKRHLEQIDRSDPNMCLVYSIQLHKRGVGKSTQVIRWADYALENKSKWSGATHTRNVYYLHQLKSQAASRLWQRAEKRFVKDRNEKNEAKANNYRSMAKQASRSWLDYAKASGKDTSKPYAACVSASGTTEFCPR